MTESYPDTGEPDVELLQSTYSQLLSIYGLEGEFRIEARTLPEYLFRKYQFGHDVPDGPEGPDWAHYVTVRAKHVLDTTKYIRTALGILKDDYGADILADRRALSDHDTYTRCIEGIRNVLGKDDPLQEMQEDRMGYVFATDIAHLFGGTKKTYRSGIQNTHVALSKFADNTRSTLISTAQLSFYESLVPNLSTVRYETHRQLRALCEDNVTAFVDYGDEVMAADSTTEADRRDVASEILQSQKQELDYTVFPPGTELRDAAELIVSQASEYTKAFIDLERLTVLERVRQAIGPDKCYLMRGKSSGKGLVDTEGTLISEDYIGLIIQHHDDNGAVTGEDCLAISPIGRRHAGYIVRQDASEGLSWREILSLSKNDAIAYFGARRLRFDPVTGKDTYDAYVEKAMTLLHCEPEKFGREYVLKSSNDGYKMVHRGRPLGNLGLRAAMGIR